MIGKCILIFVITLACAFQPFAAISFVSSDTSTHALTNGTSIAVSRPSGIEAGDLLVAIVSSAIGSAMPVYTAPAGWKPIGPAQKSHCCGSSAMFYKIAEASEDQTYTFAFNPSVQNPGAIVSAYRGCDSRKANRYVRREQQQLEYGFAAVAPSVPVRENCRGVACVYSRANCCATQTVLPAALSKRAETSVSGNVTTFSDVNDPLPTGTFSPGTYQFSPGTDAREVVMHTIVLAPADGTPIAVPFNRAMMTGSLLSNNKSMIFNLRGGKISPTSVDAHRNSVPCQCRIVRMSTSHYALVFK